MYAATALPNRSSTAFHDSFGFEPIGTFQNVGHKNEDWHDVQWWHKSLGTPSMNPDQPTAVRELCRPKQWDNAIEAGESRIDL